MTASLNNETAHTAGQDVTREAWLHEAVRRLRPYFVEVGLELPEKIQLSVSFGYSKACSKAIAGQCWKKEATEELVNTIFVSPLIKHAAQVLEVLVHELIHAALNCEDGHRKRFAEAAVRLGLEGPMTATFAGMDLTLRLMTIAGAIEVEFGKYDHAALIIPATKAAPAPVGPDGAPVPRTKMHSGESSEKNRWISFYCDTHASPVRMSGVKAARCALICTELTDEGMCMQPLRRK
jgi:hypothetical protein